MYVAGGSIMWIFKALIKYVAKIEHVNIKPARLASVAKLLKLLRKEEYSTFITLLDCVINVQETPSTTWEQLILFCSFCVKCKL